MEMDERRLKSYLLQRNYNLKDEDVEKFLTLRRKYNKRRNNILYDGGINISNEFKDSYSFEWLKGNIISGTYELISDKKLINMFKNNKLFLEEELLYINYDTGQILNEDFIKLIKKEEDNKFTKVANAIQILSNAFIIGTLSPKQKARLENLRFFFENEMMEEGGDERSRIGGGKYKKQIVKLQHQRGGDESKQGVWKERYISPQAQQNEEAEIYPILDIEFNANEEENEAEQLAAAEAAAAEAKKAAAEAAAAEAKKAAAEVVRMTDKQLMKKLEAFNNEIKFDSDVVAADGAVGNENKHRDDDSNIINEGTRILNILNNYLNAGLEEEKEDFIKLVFYYENNGTIYWNYNGDLTISQENAIETHITENEKKEEELHKELDNAIKKQETQIEEEADIRDEFKKDWEDIKDSNELNFDGFIENWSEIAKNNSIYNNYFSEIKNAVEEKMEDIEKNKRKNDHIGEGLKKVDIRSGLDTTTDHVYSKKESIRVAGGKRKTKNV